jgi:hypothetical protein
MIKVPVQGHPIHSHQGSSDEPLQMLLEDQASKKAWCMLPGMLHGTSVGGMIFSILPRPVHPMLSCFFGMHCEFN